MRPGTSNYSVLLFLLSLNSIYSCAAIPSPGSLLKDRDGNNPLNIDWDPAPSPEDGPPLSVGAIRDPAYLPAQIGGIVGAYAFSLFLVAIGLLVLAKTRRDHLRSGDELEEGLLELPTFEFPDHSKGEAYDNFPYPVQTPKSPYKNFSYPDPVASPRSERFQNPLGLNRPEQFGYPLSPTRTEQSEGYNYPSPTSTTITLGHEPAVDQRVVARDREMAQNQLEDMYKHVMEQEEAKLQGREYRGPHQPGFVSTPGIPATPVGILKKEKNKPTSLDLGQQEKPQSRTSSILSVLKSPRKKAVKGVSISSPIMTPLSGTFPRYEGAELDQIPPRQYAPIAPPPLPLNQLPFRRGTGGTLPMTPDMSPTRVTSIDGRLDQVVAHSIEQSGPISQHSRDVSGVSSENPDRDPVSAVPDKSCTGLVGLPLSPKPGVNRFPSLSTLPASPRPGQQTFARANAPPSLRTDGALPLRQYQPSLLSPRQQNTKETVFTRAGPLSPGGMQTPFTGMAVPYSPYQPFSPVIPMTPSLVTKADRKRMKRMEPKTPTLQMVRGEDDIW